MIAATALPSNDRIKLPATKPYKLKRDESLPGPDETAGDLDVGVAVGPGNMTKIVHPGSGRATIDASATGDRVIEVVGNIDLRRVKLTGGIAEHGEQSGGALNIRGFAASATRRRRQPGARRRRRHLHRLRRPARRADRRSAATRPARAAGSSSTRTPTPTWSRPAVDRNEAGDGGAIWIETGPLQDSTRIIRSTLSGNEASGDGGAIFTRSTKGLIENSTLAGNSADGRGGAIYAAPDSETRDQRRHDRPQPGGRRRHRSGRHRRRHLRRRRQRRRRDPQLARGREHGRRADRSDRTSAMHRRRSGSSRSAAT